MVDNSKTDVAKQRSRIAHGAGAAVGAFMIVTFAISLVVYTTGNSVFAGSEVAVGTPNFLDTTGTAAYGVASGVVSLVFGIFGVLFGTVAAMLSVAFGAFGLVVGFVLAAGIFAGPVLLVGAIAVLVKRRYFPDVI